MMPGGYVDRGERPSHAARRELHEESGVRARHHFQRLDEGSSGSALYKTDVRMPRSRRDRMRMFSKRKTPWETKDYGFVDPHAAIMSVTDYKGKIKSRSPLRFRPGTVSQLRKVARSSRRRTSPGPKTLGEIARTIRPGGKSIGIPASLGRQLLIPRQ